MFCLVFLSGLAFLGLSYFFGEFFNFIKIELIGTVVKRFYHIITIGRLLNDVSLVAFSIFKIYYIYVVLAYGRESKQYAKQEDYSFFHN
jgi:uncharacterized membrane protein